MIHRRLTYVAGLTLALLLSASAPAAAEVKLPSIFANHMVLQRDRVVPVWGWATPGESVQVRLDDQQQKTTADEHGQWKVQLPSHAAGGPHQLVVEEGDNRQQIDDIYFGEVWVASGQSNMHWTVKKSDNADTEIAAADWPQLRLFTVPMIAAKEPQDDCKGQWQVCSPETVAQFSAVGYFFGRDLHKALDVPVAILHTSWGGSMAEAWVSREVLESREELKPTLARQGDKIPANHRSTQLYNGMLAPIIPYGIRGAIWYQGESNVGRAAQYAVLFPAMIQDWRARWGQGDFPFYFVQLAPFRYGKSDPELCAELWDSQFQTLHSTPNMGMAVTTDIAVLQNIHPTNKQDVGKRLALWALANTHGQKDLVFSGPLYKSSELQDGKLRIRFEHLGSGLATRDDLQPNEFTIAGADRKFVPAQAKIEGDSVVVWSEAVARPVAARMGWHDTAQPNLINREGLPASPFRTDDWPLKTAGKY